MTRREIKIVVFSVVCSILVFVAMQTIIPFNLVLDQRIANAQFTSSDEHTSQMIRFVPPADVDFVSASKVGIPAVVRISAFERSSWGNLKEQNFSEGSGVIVSDDGYIVTNNHVVKLSSNIRVQLNDSRMLKATLVGTDPETDIALLKIEIPTPDFITFGNSDELEVGDWVLAIGNPYHLNSTVTCGIVSAKGRAINLLKGERSIESFIQTDAVVNEGNSGGALINKSGELVGLNTAIFTKSGKFEGYSFAIPSNLVAKAVRDIRTFGKVQRAALGIGIENLSERNSADLTLTSGGVYVNEIFDRSAATVANIKAGDIITMINKKMVHTVPELQEQIALYQPGDIVDVTIMRKGESLIKKVKLQGAYTNLSTMIRSDQILRKMGFELRDLSDSEKAQFKGNGVFVNSVYRESQVAASGIEPGFIITELNGRPITKVDELISKFSAGEKVELKGRYSTSGKLIKYKIVIASNS